jgi:hypothetical protein
VEQESPDEFVGGQGHRFTLAAITIILPLEADLIVFDIDRMGTGEAASPRKITPWRWWMSWSVRGTSGSGSRSHIESRAIILAPPMSDALD